MNRTGRTSRASSLTRSSSGAQPGTRPRQMERKLSMQNMTSSCYRPVNFQGHRSARADRHTGCKAAASSAQACGRPAWDDSTKISHADRRSLCSSARKDKFTKAAKKSSSDSGAAKKKDKQMEAPGPEKTSGGPATGLPEFSFLFKPACFSPDCSDSENHFPVLPKKPKSVG